MRVPSPAASTITRHFRADIWSRFGCSVDCETPPIAQPDHRQKATPPARLRPSVAKRESADSANVFNDSSIEGAMALELTPPEPGSRNPRRRVRELSSLLWLCGWGCGTAIALAALPITSQTETARDRLRQIFAANESSGIARMPSRITPIGIRNADPGGANSDAEHRARSAGRPHRTARKHY